MSINRDDDRVPEPLTLSPDEEQPRALHLDDDDDDGAVASPPYGIAAILAGMLLLLGISKLPFPGVMVRIDIALIGTVIVYLICSLLKLKLPTLPLAIIAAELGILYGMPAMVLFPVEMSPRVLSALVGYLVMGGITGLLVGRGFSVERNPKVVIAIAFLMTFVMAGMATFIRGLLQS